MVRLTRAIVVSRTLQFVTQYRFLVPIVRSPVVTVMAFRLVMTCINIIRVRETVVCLFVRGLLIYSRPCR